MPDPTSCILSAVEEIEDTLYYFSDVISSGVPNLGRLIADNILQLLVFPLLLPSVKREFSDVSIVVFFGCHALKFSCPVAADVFKTNCY